MSPGVLDLIHTWSYIKDFIRHEIALLCMLKLVAQLVRAPEYQLSRGQRFEPPEVQWEAFSAFFARLLGLRTVSAE